MAHIAYDRVKEATTTTSTGTLTLTGALVAFRSFSVVGNANTCDFVIYAVDSLGNPTGDWEVSTGTYTAAGTLLSRDTVLASSNSNALVNFAAGTKHVALTLPAGTPGLNALAPLQTGTGNLVFATSPTISAPVISSGTASTVPYLDAGKILTSSAVTQTELGYLSGVTSSIQTQFGLKQPLDSDLTAIASLATDSFGRGGLTQTSAANFRSYIGAGTGDALISGTLAQFAATTSLELKNLISDETGSGALVFANTPTFVTPILGVATATAIITPKIYPPSNSTTALQIFQANGTTSMFVVDSTNNRFGFFCTPSAIAEVALGTGFAASSGFRVSGSFPNIHFYSSGAAAGKHYAITQNWSAASTLEIRQSTATGGDPLNAGLTAIMVDANKNFGVGSFPVGSSIVRGKFQVVGGTGATAPTTLTIADSYMNLGGAEYGSNSYRMIGFGSLDAGATNVPAYFGYQETTSAGYTAGDFIWGVRNVTTDTQPTEVMRLTRAGLLGINKASSLGGQVHIVAGSASTIGQVVEGAASRTAALAHGQTTAAGSLGNFGMGCVADVVADVATTHTDGTFDSLSTYTTVANALLVNGDKICFDYTLTTISSATAARDFKLVWATVTIFDSTGLVFNVGAGTVRIFGYITRVTSTTAIATISFRPSGSATILGLASETFVPTSTLTGLTLTGTNALVLSAAASGTGAASGDITLRQGTVWYRSFGS